MNKKQKPSFTDKYNGVKKESVKIFLTDKDGKITQIKR